MTVLRSIKCSFSINVMKVIRIKGRRDLDDPELGSSGTQTIKVDLIRFN